AQFSRAHRHPQEPKRAAVPYRAGPSPDLSLSLSLAVLEPSDVEFAGDIKEFVFTRGTRAVLASLILGVDAVFPYSHQDQQQQMACLPKLPLR
ncbi:MAG: hypothetical protein BJ554DRAFT_4726, partial [Olpidium bornovanus]